MRTEHEPADVLQAHWLEVETHNCASLRRNAEQLNWVDINWSAQNVGS